MKVAYYSPLPPSRSGIADYSALLLPALEERMEVVVARPGRFRLEALEQPLAYRAVEGKLRHSSLRDASTTPKGLIT